MVRPLLAVVVLASGLPAAAQPPLPPDVQAERLVEAGRRAYRAGDRAAARDRFKQAVDKFGDTPAANAARYGLALVLVRGPAPEYVKAADLLQRPADDAGFPDRAAAAYLLGVCHRAVGLAEPADRAGGRFDRAKQAFHTARDLHQQRNDPEPAARARCDQAEMELRLNRPTEARTTTDPFLADPAFRSLKCRKLGLYHHGLACFQLKDYPAAGKALALAAPHTDPAVSPHADYLAGRVLHLTGEPGDAAAHYEAVLAGYAAAKKAAVQSLKSPETFATDPAEKARLEALVKAPPEYVGAAAFHLAGVGFDAGRFAAVLPKFDTFAADHPASPLAPDARLRAGVCLVQLGQPADAEKRLLVLVDVPRLADQALYWLGRAQVAKSDGGKRPDALKVGIELLEKAADRAGQRGDEGKDRRHAARLALADAKQLANDSQPAADIYEQLWNDRALPARRDEILASLCLAAARAGQLDRSTGRCEEFLREFPDSPHAPAVLVRAADNALARAADAEKRIDNPEQVAARFADAAAKFQQAADKAPDSGRAAYPRFRQGVCLLRAGQPADAAKALEAVPPAARTGGAAATAYWLADALVRQAADTPDRAKWAAAVKLLDEFVAAQPKAPEVPAALLKLAHAARLAAPPGDPAALGKARLTLERVLRDHGRDAAAAPAQVELAQVRVAAGDRKAAADDLRPFTWDDKLKAAPVAPLAVLHLATIARAAGDPAEAARLLADARNRYGWELDRDPARKEWGPLLKLHHAAALAELGKTDEAVNLFEDAGRQANGQPLAADAALGAGRARLAAAEKKLAVAERQGAEAGADAGRRDAARRAADDARGEIRATADALARRAEDLRSSAPAAAARGKLLLAASQARRAVAASLGSDGKADAAQAAATLAAVLDEFPDSAAAVAARLDLAELRSGAGDRAGAVKLLTDALDAEAADAPDADTLPRVRLALAGHKAAAGDHAGAAALYGAVAAATTPADPLWGHAQVRAGEEHLAAGDPAKAADLLAGFLADAGWDDPAGVGPRALVRLGHAQLAIKKYAAARQAFDAVPKRFGEGHPLAPDARYGAGLVSQAQGDHASAVKAFEAVAAATARPLAAQAQVQIGISRTALKQYAAAAAGLLAVSHMPEAIPAVGFAARLEAARALTLAGKLSGARDVLTKLLADAPAGSDWAKAAAERLAK